MYSDGALSKCVATTITNSEYTNRTAVGIVFALNSDMSTNDKNRGWTHGVAFALNIPGYTTWGPDGNIAAVPGKVSSVARVDKEGYNETYALRTATYPAMYMAWNYSAKNKAGSGTVSLSGMLISRTGYTAPHWYLPSCGQLVDILVNIAGLSRTPDARNSDATMRWSPPAATTFLNAVNGKLGIVKNAGYSTSSIPTGKTFVNMYCESGLYSSTPHTNTFAAYGMQVWSDDAVWFDNTTAGTDDSRSAKFNILPVISF